MRQEQMTGFRRLSLLELARNGIIKVLSRGEVVGYWVPRDEWGRIEAELVLAALRRGDVTEE
jgi:hypothetical protein